MPLLYRLSEMASTKRLAPTSSLCTIPPINGNTIGIITYFNINRIAGGRLSGALVPFVFPGLTTINLSLGYFLAIDNVHMVSTYLTYAYACNASNFLPKYDPVRTAANSSTEEVLIETGFTPSIFTPGTASALIDRTAFLNLSRLINSSTKITLPKIFVAAN